MIVLLSLHVRESDHHLLVIVFETEMFFSPSHKM